MGRLRRKSEVLAITLPRILLLARTAGFEFEFEFGELDQCKLKCPVLSDPEVFKWADLTSY